MLFFAVSAFLVVFRTFLRRKTRRYTFSRPLPYFFSALRGDEEGRGGTYRRCAVLLASRAPPIVAVLTRNQHRKNSLLRLKDSGIMWCRVFFVQQQCHSMLYALCTNVVVDASSPNKIFSHACFMCDRICDKSSTFA